MAFLRRFSNLLIVYIGTQSDRPIHDEVIAELRRELGGKYRPIRLSGIQLSDGFPRTYDRPAIFVSITLRRYVVLRHPKHCGSGLFWYVSMRSRIWHPTKLPESATSTIPPAHLPSQR